MNFLYDYGLTVGGPIRKDKLWFFASVRRWGSENQVPGVFYNKTQGTMFYTPDLDRPSAQSEWNQSNAVRLTWQLTPRNKLNIFTDITHNCVCIRLSSSAPESVALWHNFPEGIAQVSWSSPRTNRLLLEAGAAAVIHSWPNYLQPEVSPDDISINDTGLGFTYNAPATLRRPPLGQPVPCPRVAVVRDRLARVQVRHEQRVGDQGRRQHELGQPVHLVHVQQRRADPDHAVCVPVPDSEPERVDLGTRIDAPFRTVVHAMWDLGVYAQDQWTIERLTLNYGVRYDYYDVNIPAISLGPGRFVGARQLPAVEHAPRWRDWSPRFGASYDLFGTGQTALKVSIGRYLELSSGTFSSNIAPVTTSVTSANRSWTDSNRNFVPDCDLTNFAANGECQAIDNQNFGKSNPLATRYADDVVLEGRAYTWDINTEVQHQLGPGLSVTGGYYHNWDGNYRVTDNAAVADADYSPYCITAPSDPRLPGGGGYQVCGLYDINPDKFGQVSNVVTQASNFGSYTRTRRFLQRQHQHPLRRGHQTRRRHRHGTDGQRRLFQRRQPWRDRGESSGRVRDAGAAHRHHHRRAAHLPRRDALRRQHAAETEWQLSPADGRLRQRRASEPAGHGLPGHVCGANGAGGGLTRTEPVGRHAYRQCPADLATDRLRKPPHAAGPADQQDHSGGTNPPAGESGYLQRAQRQLGAGSEQHVRPAVAAAVADPGSADDPAERTRGVLISTR